MMKTMIGIGMQIGMGIWMRIGIRIEMRIETRNLNQNQMGMEKLIGIDIGTRLRIVI